MYVHVVLDYFFVIIIYRVNTFKKVQKSAASDCKRSKRPSRVRTLVVKDISTLINQRQCLILIYS